MRLFVLYLPLSIEGKIMPEYFDEVLRVWLCMRLLFCVHVQDQPCLLQDFNLQGKAFFGASVSV